MLLAWTQQTDKSIWNKVKAKALLRYNIALLLLNNNVKLDLDARIQNTIQHIFDWKALSRFC